MSVLRGTVYLSISRVASILLNVWAIGRFVQWLGNEAWGGIALMTVFSAICTTLCDLGLGTATINSMVRAKRNKDQAEANRILATHTTITLALSSVLSIIFAVAFASGYVQSVGQDLPGVLYYGCAAATTIFVLLNIGQNAALVSEGRYSYIALVATISAFVNTGLSLWLIHETRHPWGFWAGSLAGTVVTAIANEVKIRKLGFSSPRVGVFRKEFEGLRAFVKRSVFTNSASLLSGLDRVALSKVVSQAHLGIYDQAARIPATLTSTMPLAQVFPAEIARIHLEGTGAIKDAYMKLSAATMALMMAVLFIPSACGESFLRLIYPTYEPVMATLFALASLDAAFAIYGSLFAIFANATGRPQLTAPFIWFMMLGTAFLAVPSAAHYGLIGVAGCRVVLQLVQFVPLEWAIKKSIAPSLDLNSAVGKKAFIMCLALVFWVVGYRVFHTLGWQNNALAGFLLAVVLSYGYVASLVAIGAIWLPRQLLRLLPPMLRSSTRRPT